MMRKVFAVTVALSLLCLGGLAQAEILYSENFEAASQGQSLQSAPLNWQPYAGVGQIRVGTNLRPGWEGKAVDGSSTSDTICMGLVKPLVIPNTGVIRLSFRAWADQLHTGNCTVALISPTGRVGGVYGGWDTSRYWDGTPRGVWQFNSYMDGSGTASYLPEGFGFNQTVTCVTVVDYTSHCLWGEMTSADGATWRSPDYSFEGSPVIGGINLWESINYWPDTPLGLDVDDIVLEAVPEPSSLLALASGLGCLLALVRRRK